MSYITKTSSIPSSYLAEVIANNQDLLTEILLRLPIKSLLIFKSVSKHWLSLITNPNFSLRRTPYPNPASGLFLQTPNIVRRMHNPEYDFISLNQNTSNPSKSPFKTLNFVHDRYGIQILQSCNGLLLCSSFDARVQKRVKYYVYNPTTKQYTTLPQLKAHSGNIGMIFGVNLAFDHSMSPHYKVICIRRLNFAQYDIDYLHCQIEIYSSEAGPWRHSGSSFSVAYDTGFHQGVHWKSSIHWLSASNNSLYCYHIDEERASEMPLPHIPNVGERMFEYFGETEGRLHLIETYKNTGTTLYVYEMDRDYRGWIAKFCVDLGEVSIAFPDMFQGDLELTQLLNSYVFHITYVVQGENDEDSYMVLRIPKKVIQYYFKNKAAKKLYDIDENVCTESSLLIGWNYVYPYIESLTCI